MLLSGALEKTIDRRPQDHHDTDEEQLCSLHPVALGVLTSAHAFTIISIVSPLCSRID